MPSIARNSRVAWIPVVAGVAWCLIAAGAVAAQQAKKGESACIVCHRLLEDEWLEPVTLWPKDVHAEVGLGCEDCHGGDASPALAEDLESMSPQRGFRPAPSRLETPDFCGRCHSDLSYMRKFNPQARVDQLTEYRTSAHGMGNAQGDPVAAVCTDCHGIHGITRANNPDSPVYASNVPRMCATCHADAEKMAPYGIPVNQLEEYEASVHGIALLDHGDIAAPACNDCHGNHGASPPGVESVAYVCGQCHGRESTLFRASFKKDLFDAMEVAECTVCHGNHRVRHPTPALFYGGSEPRTSHGRVSSTRPLTVELGTIPAGEVATVEWITVLPLRQPDHPIELRHGIDVSADREHLQLDAGVLPGATLEPPRVFTGKTLEAQLKLEPISGWPVRIGDALRVNLQLRAIEHTVTDVVVQDRPSKLIHTVEASVCLTCHSPGDECDQATVRMYGELIDLERRLRDAGALLERARQVGMEVSEPAFELKSKGATAGIEVRALIHSFDPEALIARAAEGREVADGALAAGEAAMDEMQYRRKGLAVSLTLVLFVVVGLYMKIRQIDRGEAS